MIAVAGGAIMIREEDIRFQLADDVHQTSDGAVFSPKVERLFRGLRKTEIGEI